MAITHAQPGELVDVKPLGSALSATETRTLVRTNVLDVIRLVVRAGKEIPMHKAKGEIVVHCLEGKIAFTACGKTHDLEGGQLLYLPSGEYHSLRGIEDGSLLLTIVASSIVTSGR